MNDKRTTGLTTEQIRERIQAGQVNTEQTIRTKTYGQIVRGNLFTLFNLINVILLVCILFTGSLKNALFFLVVIWNFLIGVIQEIRAKKTIERLSLLSAPKVTALRNGKPESIAVSDIVYGEVMQLKSGFQVCADALVLEGSCQVNESLITGESTPIKKKTGDHLLSGSFLISGEVLAEAEHVGAENYVNQITASAGYYKKPDSVIMKSVKRIVQIIAVCLIPLAGLQVWNNFFRTSSGFSAAMIRTVASVSAMIPGGLVLLVSIVLAVSVVRLSVHHTLVQDLYCVENLARVDMILLDKTGTITEGVLKVEKTEPFAPYTLEEIHAMLLEYMSISGDDNTTSKAIRNYLKENNLPCTDRIIGREDEEYIPFSSERKWGMVQKNGRLLILGAPEFVVKTKDSEWMEQLYKYSRQGKRAVLLAVSHDPAPSLSQEEEEYRLPDHTEPAALIIIDDQIRREAPATFSYFKKENVSIKVITGDSPVTASRVAQDAGLEGARMWVDASVKNDRELEEAAEAVTVFGRVTPQQKCRLVKALQSKGHTVAMIGDGANDVLALKEADCSIAMQNGADAARNVANMVLMDSNFASLPVVVAEGRKAINNLQRSASLYLTKTTYAFMLSICFFIITDILYPFENIHMTLIGALTIGVPSFFLALEPDSRRIRNQFLWNVLRLSVPGGILEAAALMILLSLLHHAGIKTPEILSTASLYLMLIMGIMVIFDISGRVKAWKLLLIAGLTGVCAGAVLLFPKLFSIASLTPQIWNRILILAGGFFVIHFVICRILIPGLQRKEIKKDMKKSV